MDPEFLRAEEKQRGADRKPVERMGEYDGGRDRGVRDRADHESDLGC